MKVGVRNFRYFVERTSGDEDYTGHPVVLRIAKSRGPDGLGMWVG
jgi:hypothetical protein